MHGNEIHFRVIVLLGDHPVSARVPVVARGVAWYDGDRIELRDEESDEFLCLVPDDLLDQAIPVAGRIRDWLPGADYYIVCGEDCPR